MLSMRGGDMVTLIKIQKVTFKFSEGGWKITARFGSVNLEFKSLVCGIVDRVVTSTSNGTS